MAGSISTAQEFFAKYISAKQRIDQDLLSAGVQTNAPEPEKFLQELKNDFESLPSDQKYAVFKRLQRGGDSEVLKQLIPLKLFSQESLLAAHEEGAGSILYDTTEKTFTWFEQFKTEKDIWTQRLALAETLFVLDQVEKAELLLWSTNTSLNEGNTSSDEESYAFTLPRAEGRHYYLHQKLSDIYTSWGQKQAQNQNGNPLFDTDDDFDETSDPKTWEQAFDHLDSEPLEEKCKFPEDDQAWKNLKIGEKVSSGNITVVRTSENDFEFHANISLGVKDPSDVALLSPKILSALAMSMELRFTDLTKNFEHHFSLHVNLKAVDKDADITLTKEAKRGNSGLWTISEQRKQLSGFLLHEFFHSHFHFPDYYLEPLASNGARDHSLEPGFAVLAENHLMQTHVGNVHIFEHDLFHVIAKEIKVNQPRKTHGENFDNFSPLFFSVIQGMLLFESNTDDAKKEVQTVLLEKQEELPHITDQAKKNQCLYNIAELEDFLGNRVRALEIYRELAEKNPHDGKLIRQIDYSTQSWGDIPEDLFQHLNENLRLGGDIGNYANFLFSHKKFSLALGAIQHELANHPMGMTLITLYAGSLAGCGRLDEAKKTLEKIAEIYTFNKNHQIDEPDQDFFRDIRYTLDSAKTQLPESVIQELTSTFESIKQKLIFGIDPSLENLP